MSAVLRWIDDPNQVHPVIAELRSRPGEWGVLWEEGGDLEDLWAVQRICVEHPRVQRDVQYREVGRGRSPVRVAARWTPDEEWRGCRGGHR